MRTEHFIALDTHCATTDMAVVTGRGRLTKRLQCTTAIPPLPQAQEPLHQRIVAVIAAVAEFTVSQQQVQHQLQEERCSAEHLSGPLMGKTACQPGLQPQGREELLEHHQPRKRRQRLVLEFQSGQGMGFTTDLAATILHETNLLAGCCSLCVRRTNPQGGSFFLRSFPSHAQRGAKTHLSQTAPMVKC